VSWTTPSDGGKSFPGVLFNLAATAAAVVPARSKIDPPAPEPGLHPVRHDPVLEAVFLASAAVWLAARPRR
jgi:hypothetical protein